MTVEGVLLPEPEPVLMAEAIGAEGILIGGDESPGVRWGFDVLSGNFVLVTPL